MTTRMVHPEHGATHAYDTGEIDRLKAIGWSVETKEPAGFTDVVIRAGKPLPEVLPTLETVSEKRKPGRPAKAK